MPPSSISQIYSALSPIFKILWCYLSDLNPIGKRFRSLWNVFLSYSISPRLSSRSEEFTCIGNMIFPSSSLWTWKSFFTFLGADEPIASERGVVGALRGVKLEGSYAFALFLMKSKRYSILERTVSESRKVSISWLKNLYFSKIVMNSSQKLIPCFAIPCNNTRSWIVTCQSGGRQSFHGISCSLLMQFWLLSSVSKLLTLELNSLQFWVRIRLRIYCSIGILRLIARICLSFKWNPSLSGSNYVSPFVSSSLTSRYSSSNNSSASNSSISSPLSISWASILSLYTNLSIWDIFFVLSIGASNS